jgi:carbamoyl-phosphate synthase large subunit
VLERAGIVVERVAKVSEGADNVVELIRTGAVDLVMNTPFGRTPRSDGSLIRTAAAAAGVPCITTLPGVFAAGRGIEALGGDPTEPRSIQEHHAAAADRPSQARLTFDAAAAAEAPGGPAA